MRKIRMNPDDLRVESFETVEDGAEDRGTVRANATGIRTHCDDFLSGPYPCEQSYAITDGVAVCPCGGGTTYCTD